MFTTMLLTTLLAQTQVYKQVNGVIYECLPGKYEQCGKGLLGFNYEDFSDRKKFIVKVGDNWVVVNEDEIRDAGNKKDQTHGNK